jgi:hypothetical protein
MENRQIKVVVDYTLGTGVHDLECLNFEDSITVKGVFNFQLLDYALNSYENEDFKYNKNIIAETKKLNEQYPQFNKFQLRFTAELIENEKDYLFPASYKMVNYVIALCS